LRDIGTPATLAGQNAFPDDSQTAGSFRHQHAAVREEREAEGILKRARHRGNADPHTLSGVELHWHFRQWPICQTARCDWNTVLHRNRLLAGHNLRCDCENEYQGQAQA
jgi:hypothetical protein